MTKCSYAVPDSWPTLPGCYPARMTKMSSRRGAKITNRTLKESMLILPVFLSGTIPALRFAAARCEEHRGAPSITAGHCSHHLRRRTAGCDRARLAVESAQPGQCGEGAPDA